MKVRLAVLADAANQSADGKLNLLGEFNLIWADQLPVVWPRFFLVMKLEAEPGEPAVQSFSVRVVDEDANDVGVALDGELDFSRWFLPGIPRNGAFILEFRNAQFSRAGTYEFHVTANGSRVADVPLYVRPRSELESARG